MMDSRERNRSRGSFEMSMPSIIILPVRHDMDQEMKCTMGKNKGVQKDNSSGNMAVTQQNTTHMARRASEGMMEDGKSSPACILTKCG